MQTEILTPIDLTRDDNLIFLFDGSSDFTTGDIAEAYEDATGAKAASTRRHDRLVFRSDDAPGIEILGRKLLLEQAQDDEQADVLRDALQMSPVRGLTVARDAQPVEITAPDPRAYALAAYVLGRDDDGWAERARFAAALVRERGSEQFSPEQEAAFPELCGSPEGQLGYRGP